jgi:hypothetical protein
MRDTLDVLNKSITTIALLIFAMACLACSAQPAATTPNATTAQSALAGLPTPGQAAAVLRSASTTGDTVLARTGADFISGLEQNVDANGANADYSPGWDSGATAFTGVAFAIYRFNLSDFSGEQALYVNWTTAPADLTNVWIGCSDWTGDRWKWIAGPDASGKLTMPGTGFAPFTRTSAPVGEMLVACVALGTVQSTLAHLSIGAAAPTGWVHSWGTEQGEEGWDVAVDQNGDVFVGGYTYALEDVDNATDCMVYKYRGSDGVLLWQKKWGGDHDDVLWSIALDAAGNLYGVGSSSSFTATPGTGSALLLLKYSPDGNLLLHKTYDSPSDPAAIEDGNGIGVDSAGNIYLTGGSNGFATDDLSHPLLLKLDTDGNLLWQKQFTAALPAWDAMGCAIGADDLPYFVAYGADVEAFSWLMVKSGADGVPVWQKILGPFYDETSPKRVKVDPLGNMYIAGYAYSASTGNDALAVKLNADGSLAWQTAWGTAELDEVYDLAVSASGEVYVAGRTEESGAGLSQALLLRLLSDGSISGAQAGVGSDWNAFYGIECGAYGELYFSGSAPDATFSWAAANASTATAPAYILENETTAPEDVTGTLADVTGADATAVGTADTGGGTDDMLVIKYVP